MIQNLLQLQVGVALPKLLTCWRVHIHEFQGGLLHAKDHDNRSGIVALIGSANLDRRSLELEF